MSLAAPNMGFTLVELIIVVSIIAIMSGFLIPNFNGYITNQNLQQGQDMVVTDLRSLQNKALTGVQFDETTTTHWGVKFTPNSNTYQYFLSGGALSNDCTNPTIESTSKMLPGDVVVKNSGDFCVFFTFDNGDAVTVGAGSQVILGHLGSSSTCVGITVNGAGGIVESTTTCP